MGLEDMLKQQIRDRAPELKQKLVDEFDEPRKRTWTRQVTIPTR
jgi:phage regulator Rha-like protein